jgi:hypothetical protein
MKNCYMTKQIGGESFFFEDNVYTTIELKHVKCFTLFYMMTISNLITQIENEIQIIEYYRDHLIQFKKRRNFKEATKRIRKINENYFKAIELKEIEFTKIFEEIENVKRLENMYDQINKGEEKDENLNIEVENDGNNEDYNKENEALIKQDNDLNIIVKEPDEEIEDKSNPNIGFLNRYKLSKEALSNEYKINFNKANDEEIENKLKSEVENLKEDDINFNKLKEDEMDVKIEEDNLSSGKKKRASIFDSIIKR